MSSLGTRIAVFGVVGALLGQVYSLCSVGKKKKPVDIAVPHQYLDQDEQLLIFLDEVCICKDLDYHLYLQLIDAMDRMIGHKQKLETEKQGTLRDRTRTFRMMEKIRHITTTFEHKLEAVGSLQPRDIIAHQDTLRKIRVVIESYYKVIITLTSH